MTADPLVYDRKNKRKILTHIDGRKQYFTLNNRAIEDPEQPYSDVLRAGMWKAYQLGREYNHSHKQVMDYMRSWPQMNRTILDEIAQRGTEAIPDVPDSARGLALHEPYQFKSDADLRDIRRYEDEDVMSETYHSVRFNGGSQAEAEKAVREVAKKYNMYSPHVKGYLARTKTYRDADFTDPDAKAGWELGHTEQEPTPWLTPEYSRKIDRILNGYDPNRDMRDERPIQTYSALPEDLAKYFDSDEPIPTWHDGLNSLAADNIRSTNVPAMYNSPEPKPVKKAVIDYSVSAGYPDWLPVSDKAKQPDYPETPESQYVLQALSKQGSNKKVGNKAEPMAADYTRVYPDVVPISIESEEYDLPEEKEKPVLESEYVSQGIHASGVPAAVQQAANPLNTTGQVVRAPVMPNLDPASYVPVNMPARVSQPVLNEYRVKARLDALPDKAISSAMPIQAKPVSKEQIQQNAAESMVRAAYKYNAPEMPKRQQETKSQDINGNAVLEQPSKYEVPEVTAQVQQPAKQLTEEEIVNGVLHGDYDNGAERIKKLRALGLNDTEIKHIQDIVNARIYAGRAMVQRKKTAPRAPKRVSRQQMYNGFPVNYRPY